VLRKRIYALSAIAGGLVFYLLAWWGMSHTVAIIIGSVLTFALRMLATVFKWNLPKAIK
jgi:uncharacterized membrane protein YeiH